MKKIVLLVFILSVLGLCFIKKSDDEFLNNFLGLKFDYVLTYDSRVCDESLIDVGVVKIGFYSNDKLNLINKKNKQYIQSETVVLGGVEVDEILNILDAKVVKKYKIGDVDVYQCYSKGLKKFNYEKRVKFNLQIAVNFDEVKIGYPTIVEGF